MSNVEYPRPNALYGTSADLQRLADGYFGLTKVFGWNVVVNIFANFAISGGKSFTTPDLTVFLVVGLLIGVLAYRPMRLIGQGAHWVGPQAVIAATLLGINSALCCGLAGYVVMWGIAAHYMKPYGIKGGFFGLRKADVMPFIRALKKQEEASKLAG